MASPEDFGAGVGKALQGFGNQLATSADQLSQYAAKQEAQRKNEERAVNNATTDLVSTALDAQQKAPADGKGMAKATMDALTEQINKEAEARYPTDERERNAYKADQLARAAGLRDRATQAEATQRLDYSRVQANSAIGALTNKVRTDPSQFEQASFDLDKVIDSSTVIPEGLKPSMRKQAQSDLASARFDSQLTAAKSVEDFDALDAELKEQRWQETLDPKAFERTQDAIKTSKNHFMTVEGAKATAALSSMEARSKDRQLIPPEEMAEMAATAKNAKSPAVALRFQKVYQEQEDLKAYGKLPPDQIEGKSREIAGKGAAAPDGSIGSMANEASKLTGGTVSSSYLLGKLGIEYSAEDIRAGKYNEPNKAGMSSARGLFQFVDGTWLSVLKRNPSVFGADITDENSPTGLKPDAVLLGMRNNPEMQFKAAALYAQENAKILQAQGLPTGDAELYLAHMLGGGGGPAFLKAMQANPSGPVVASGAFTQAQIDANRPVFYNKDGTAKTFTQVYNNVAARFAPGAGGGISGVQYDRSQNLQAMADAKKKAISNDPMTQAREDGIAAASTLSDVGSFMKRGQEAMTAANYYGVPLPDMKPFTADEAAQMSKRLKEGTSDEQLAMLAQIQAMDKAAPGMAKAAMAQLGEKDSVMGHAASVAFDQGDDSTASKIVRGNKRIEDDKTNPEMFGKDKEAEMQFNRDIGLALDGVSPEAKTAIFNSARAHYAETVGKDGLNGFNPKAFSKSVQAVLGGEESVGSVNGQQTVLPKGVTAREFDAAIDSFKALDYVAMSVDGNPPKYADGTTVDPSDIAYEGVPRFIGNGTYTLELANGQFAVSGDKDQHGRSIKYQFRPTKEAVQRAITAPRQTTSFGSNTAPANAASGVPRVDPEATVNPQSGLGFIKP